MSRHRRQAQLRRSHQTAWARTHALAALELPTGTQRFGTCAVVGSSGVLLRDRFGAEIDAHDVVLRFNNAPTAGFEAIVGSRTTLRLLNSHAAAAVLQRCADFSVPARAVNDTCPAGEHSCCPRESVLLNSGRARVAECYRKACNARAPNVKELLRNDSLVRAFERLVSPMTVVSGVYGLVAALLLCTDRVDMYGVSPPNRSLASGPPSPYHYYDKCTHFETDALSTTARGIAAMSGLARQAVTASGVAEVRLVPPTGAHSSWVAATDAVHPCPKRSGIREISWLLEKGRRAGREVPCCNQTWPEPNRMGVCSWAVERGGCTLPQRRHECPVACEVCRVCPGSVALPAYLKLFARMTLPPLPHLYGHGLERKYRPDALNRALRGVAVFAPS